VQEARRRADQNAAGPVAEVCRHLDGIPLALELASARVKTLTIGEIAARLDDRFQLLTGGPRTAEARQPTLRATVQWSHQREPGPLLPRRRPPNNDRGPQIPLTAGRRHPRHAPRPQLYIKFLHFPTEGHGITRPAIVQLWFQTVFAFLDTALHGKRWVKPRQL
jgi:hypothetical protein